MIKRKYLVLIIIAFILLTGCQSKEKKQIISNGESVNTSKMVHEHCTRKAKANAGIKVELNYDIYYTGENLNLIYSEEKVISANEEDLNEYEKAYRSIHSHYAALEYYDTEVERTDTTITSKMTINYDKIDIQKLIDIEGEEDNIFENGKAKVDKWLELAKKFGTTCEKVED